MLTFSFFEGHQLIAQVATMLASNIWNFRIMPNAIETVTRHTYRCDPWRRACLRSGVVRT